MPTIPFGIPGSWRMAVFPGGLAPPGIEPGPSMITPDLHLTDTMIRSLTPCARFWFGIVLVLFVPVVLRLRARQSRTATVILSDSAGVALLARALALIFASGTLDPVAVELADTRRAIGLTQRRDWFPARAQAEFLQDLRLPAAGQAAPGLFAVRDPDGFHRRCLTQKCSALRL